ncbi:CoB--CoM heterodisulfide reductase iron-sulfur subunit A family protein [Thermosulfurimonas marina]|nr:CoB--CoM heterodisulfide reductase iron-sulfur subunit A family protein [Thermosulfurimonas marina]
MKIGLFLCECGGNISEKIHFETLVKRLSGLEDLKIFRHPFLCSPEGQSFFREKARGLSGVLVAACSPHLHQETFWHLIRKEAPQPLKWLALREEVAWTSGPEATEKAERLLKFFLRALRRSRPPALRTLKPMPHVLILGAGAAGIKAALRLNACGLEVSLVEREPFVGGKALYLDRLYPRLECASCVVSPLISALAARPEIRVFTQARLVKVEGEAGDFVVEVETLPRFVDLERCNGCGKCLEICPRPGALERDPPHPFPQAPVLRPQACLHFQGKKCQLCQKACPKKAFLFREGPRRHTLRVGGLIVATGFQPYPGARLESLGYGRLPEVTTLYEVEKALSQGKAPGGQKRPQRIAIVHCAGSREQGHLPYCSEVCCGFALKASLRLKELYPEAEITHFYQDLRLRGLAGEELYRRARRAGLRFVRGRVAEISPIPYPETSSRGVTVVAEDTLARRRLKWGADLVILVPGFVPERGAGEVAGLLGLCPDEYGFFEPREEKTAPVESFREGIWLAGACTGPKNLADSVATAEAAALAAFLFLRQESLVKEAPSIYWHENRCGFCQLCVELCPFAAIRPLEGQIKIDPGACRHCGLCVSACPSGALEGSEGSFTEDWRELWR